MKRTADQAATDAGIRSRLSDWSNKLKVYAWSMRLRPVNSTAYDGIVTAEAGLHRQQGEVTQCDGVITRLTDLVDKMRGESAHPRIKLDELRDQSSSLRKDLQELRATLEDRNSRRVGRWLRPSRS